MAPPTERSGEQPGGGPRRRLPPEERRRELMGAAAEIVATDGQGALTMERLAKRAGVSNGTVYLYFANRADVLLALLKEHWSALDREMAAVATAALSFEELVREVVRTYLAAVGRRGPAFSRFNHEPSVEPAVEARRLARRSAYLAQFANQYQETFGLPPAESRAAAGMLLAALDAGADLMLTDALDPQVVANVQVALIIGGLGSLADRDPLR